MCTFYRHYGRQHLQWKMHCASSTATAGDKMGSGRCMVHIPLPLRTTTFAVEDTRCTINCYCWRQHGQWKICCASSNAIAGDNMGSGTCIVQLPLRLLATTWAMEDARCIIHCHCLRQTVQQTMHGTSSTATAGDNMGSGRCTVHLQLPLMATKWAVDDALCIFHCNCGRHYGQ